MDQTIRFTFFSLTRMGGFNGFTFMDEKNKKNIESKILTTKYLHNARFHYYEASQIFCVIKEHNFLLSLAYADIKI